MSAAPLALLLVLQLSGSDGELFYPTVIEGDDVTLSCKNEFPDQHPCKLTTWFIDTNKPRALFKHGNEDKAVSSSVSSSVSLLQNCSMVLHRVTKELAGNIFTCRQDKKQNDETRFQMFVASLSQEKKDDTVTLTCFVATPGNCIHEVKWLNNNEEVKKYKELQTSRSFSDCLSSVSFKDPSPPSPFYQTLKCKVKQSFPDQIFTLFPRAPGEKTGCDGSEATSGHVIKNALLIAGLVTLLLSVAAVQLYARVKERGASERSRANVTRGGAVVYENEAEPSVSVRFHSQPSEN